MNAYNLIKNKLSKKEYNFDTNLLEQLIPSEFEEINRILEIEVYKGNSNCYKYLKYLKGINLAQLLSTGHRQKLSDDNWALLITNIYLASPSPSILDHIVEMASTNDMALEQLKIIAQIHPEIVELRPIIQQIEAQKKSSNKVVKTMPTEKFEYFELDFGAIVKVKKDKFLLYRLDPNTKQWIEDHEMYMELARGSYSYKPININDSYPTLNAVDQNKGMKL